jgi:hypothetical protein
MRIAAPPTTDPCFYGIDTPQREKLLASRYDVAGMAKFIGVDLLAFLSIDGLYRAMGLPGRDPNNPGFATPASPETIRSRSTTWWASKTASFRRSSNRLEAFRDCGLPVAWPVVCAGHRALALAPRPPWLCSGRRALCWSRAPSAAWKLDDRIAAAGGSATLVPLDVTDGPASTAWAPLHERFGRLDVLLGNVGPRRAVADRAHRSRRVRAGDGGERDGQSG